MAKTKTQVPTDEKITSWYADYTLMYGKTPNSVYEFAKSNQFDEAEFYKYFASFEALEQHFFSQLLNYTIALLSKTLEYEAYDAAQKLSCFYFTFFELATANRSFIVYLLKNEKTPLKNIAKLKLLRRDFLVYIKTILETPYKIENQKINNIQNRVIHEGAWLQFMSILKYWIDDTSASFEKTDIFIEKSVKASFDMVYNVPVESIIDFGKFIWKEKFGNFNSKK